MLRTAALVFGAAVANYTRVVRLTTREDGEGRRAVVRTDPDNGDESGVGDELTVRARVVVNATGVWADAVRALEQGAASGSLRPAKGVHVTIPADRLPCDVAAVIPVPKDRRSIFVVPWPGLDLVYLGTTDTDYTGPLADPACTPEDVDYLLEAANNVTTSSLTRADVTGVWAGLRPLLAPSTKGGHVSERTSDLSRRHTVSTSPHGLVTVTGGKLTTYRKMAQDTVDAAVRVLGESPRRRPLRHEVAGPRRCDDEGAGPGRAGATLRPPPGSLRHRVRGRTRPSQTAARSCWSRPCPGCPTREPSSSTRPARRWRSPSTTCWRGGRGRGSSGRTPPWRPRRRWPGCWRPRWDGTSAKPPDQASRFVASCQKELLTAGLELA